MKAILSLLLLLNLASLAKASATINSANHFAYGANIGWIDWRGDATTGAVIGEFICSGYIYSANVGWIHLGSGSPANGIRYQNNSPTDYGVNHDGLGNLSGYAYGANIGWINFTNRDATGALLAGPKFDLRTGRFGGFVWSANCGWISLSNAMAFVQTDTIQTGADSDGDGLPDAWERLNFGNLTTANGTSDNDGDGFSDLQEYLAGTNPRDASSFLTIVSYSASPGGSPAMITWTSQPTRFYQIQQRLDLNAGSLWSDMGLGLISPDAGPTTSRGFTVTASPQSFFQIQAVRPLLP